MIRLSVVIPSYRDPLLHKTIDSLLEASGLGPELEILAVLDGYWSDTPVKTDPRVRVVHLGKNRGMRGAINAGVLVSRGEFIMRTDEHAMFSPGYDCILTETCEPNWIVTPRRFCLDPVKWEVMKDIPPVDYMKLKIVGAGSGQKFSGVEWRRPDRDTYFLDETPAMQGSCWLMPRAWWDSVIGELQTDGYGPLTQDSHEMTFKTWQASGKLMVNKLAWHAHKHRSFPRTHNGGSPENPANTEASYSYALSVWKDYYTQEIAPRWA
jgi:GT2 family glycosyltransferase